MILGKDPGLQITGSSRDLGERPWTTDHWVVAWSWGKTLDYRSLGRRVILGKDPGLQITGSSRDLGERPWLQITGSPRDLGERPWTTDHWVVPWSKANILDYRSLGRPVILGKDPRLQITGSSRDFGERPSTTDHWVVAWFWGKTLDNRSLGCPVILGKDHGLQTTVSWVRLRSMPGTLVSGTLVSGTLVSGMLVSGTPGTLVSGTLVSGTPVITHHTCHDHWLAQFGLINMHKGGLRHHRLLFYRPPPRPVHGINTSDMVGNYGTFNR